MRWDRYITSFFLAALVFLTMSATVYAAGKPEITSHTVQALERALSFNIQWHSENPVAIVRIIAGQGEKEIRIDEYDNRRNPSGYSGEVTAVIPVDPVHYSGTIPYQIQLVDDLRQRSDLFSGQARTSAVAMPGMIPAPVMMPPPGMMPPGMVPPPAMMPGQGGMMMPGGAAMSGMPSGQQDDGWGRSNIRAGKGQGTEPGGEKSNDMVDKMLKVAERFDTPPALEPIRVNVLGPENVTFTSRANDDKGLRDITFRVYDSVGNKVGEQVLTNLGKKWEGSTQPVKLTGGGNFRVVAQAVDSAGNTSKEEIAIFSLKGPQLPTSLTVSLMPPTAVAAGAQWQLDGGAWQAPAASVATTAGKHTISFKDAAGWVKPVPQEFQVAEGPNTATGTYTISAPINGTLTVTIVPAAVATAGAQWRIGGGAWQNSGASLAVPAGTVAVEFKDSAGWVKPVNLTVTVQDAKNTNASASYGRLYTFNKDFEEGQLVGLEDQTVKDQLQLSKSSSTLPFIWIPNSNNGTISKIDSRTGDELGRYLTGPTTGGSPSRTTVDLKGNCWVGNRNTGTVVKVGLSENGQCMDRNGNGKIETSTGPAALPWGQDECVLFEVVLNKGAEVSVIPGTAGAAYNSSGPRGIAVDKNNNVWAGTFSSKMLYYIDGASGAILRKLDTAARSHGSYGALIDQNGLVWSADISNGNVLRLDPATNAMTVVSLGHQAYGLGLDKMGNLYVAGWTNNVMSKINTQTSQILWKSAGEAGIRGVAVTNDGDIWTANSISNTVTRWGSDGSRKASIPGMNHPTGVAVDADGKVWVVNYSDDNILRINPSNNAVELKKGVGASGHYGYSDMTGIVARSMTTKLGTWTVTLDAKTDNTGWGSVSWNGTENANATIKVRARVSNNMQVWSNWEELTKGAAIKSAVAGRYIQVESSLQLLSGDASPLLTDLTITAK